MKGSTCGSFDICVPGRHVLGDTVLLKWHTEPIAVPIAEQVARFVPLPSEQTVAAHHTTYKLAGQGHFSPRHSAEL